MNAHQLKALPLSKASVWKREITFLLMLLVPLLDQLAVASCDTQPFVASPLLQLKKSLIHYFVHSLSTHKLYELENGDSYLQLERAKYCKN
jgi:hypothetical protein